MDSPEILQFVDKAVCANTGKHLNNLQRGILAGILKRQRYADVAETYDYSSQHVKRLVANFCKCYLRCLVNKLKKVILNPS